MKGLTVDAAQRNGWIAETECVGQTHDGERWIADVLAVRGERRLAVEIQWSAQTLDETLRRHERYRASDIEGLWLARKLRFGGDPTFLVVQISGSVTDGFQVSIPTGRGAQNLPLIDFLDAWFAGRVRYGLPDNAPAHVSVSSGDLFCWSCGAQTTICTGVNISVGPISYCYSVPDLTKQPLFWRRVKEELPVNTEIGPIRMRYSGMQGRSYLSNGCAHCGKLIGEFFEYEGYYDQREIASFSMRLDDDLRKVIRSNERYVDGWAAYKTSDLDVYLPTGYVSRRAVRE